MTTPLRLMMAAATSLTLLLGVSGPIHAEPTRLTVRVLAHDAKLIGDYAGGARVTVRARDTGEVLARGLHRGGTGSTERIVVEPQVRGEAIYDTEGAAQFRCELDLDEPTWVTVEASGPEGTLHSEAHASRTLLLLPGHHVGGDGVVLRLQGLIVNLLEPHAEATLHAGDRLDVRVGVKLLCTCPIYEGSLWEAGDYSVEAQLWHQGERLASVPLTISDEANIFAGELAVPGPEADEAGLKWVELRVVAANDHTHNYGFDRTIFRLQR